MDKLRPLFLILIFSVIVIFAQMINYLPTYFTEIDKQIIITVSILLFLLGMLAVVFR